MMASPWDDNILDKDFKILTPLGVGSFGEVKLACHIPTKTQVAVKILSKKCNTLDEIKSEVKILETLEHSNIIHFFHVVDTQSKTYIIMEYVAGKDLQMFLSEVGCLKEQEARPIFQQVVSAVHFLHQRRIAHRDIKLENILIDGDGNVKLCDFGMAIQLAEGQKLEELCGSLLYIAPEMLARKPYDGLAVDMWSLGVVLYVMVTGQFPYTEDTLHGMHRLITNTKYPVFDHLSKPCHITIAQLLMVPTKRRITIYQLVRRPWLDSVKTHTTPTTKEILPRLVETMCTMGYNLEDIFSTLRYRQPNNVTATFNILKHKLSSEDSHKQTEHPCLKSSHIDAQHPLFSLKRRASEPALATIREAGKRQSKKEGVEGRCKSCQSLVKLNKYSCLELKPCSEVTVTEGNVLMANVIKCGNGDIGDNMNSVDIWPGDLSLFELHLDGRPTLFLNMDFSTEEPSMEPNIPNDQPEIESTTSASRPFKGWKRMRNEFPMYSMHC
ncbi:sperm motility kinase-like [Chionomys nivalis]|uniref:sperm motility kinase-like n=1 Tax=Chionomys nivalis TaxID=269649 RepID=UPI002599E17F|nr:sperm motility kinase-like [Chionomys nivalis]XP_057650308.1 sperm motility kinase-like [Chionomys nivalis]